jgi:uncharacterized protein YndB with AHSA1/START domain
VLSRPVRVIWLLLGVGSFAALGGLFLLDTTWEVSRQRDLAAPPEAIFPLLEDLQAWKQWSPWQETDYQGLVYTYSGPPRGAGAQMVWDHETTGDGSLRITASEPPRLLRFDMAFQEGRVKASDSLELLRLGNGRTRVVWTDRGNLGHTLLGRLSLPVIEKSMGRDLERGLANLARVVEGSAAGAPAPSPAPAPSVSPASAPSSAAPGRGP